MRRYADPVEVRQGPLEDDARGLGAQGATEGPQQFLWRGRLWKVRAVLAHWVETGPWWQSAGARAVDRLRGRRAPTSPSAAGRSAYLATCSPSASCGGSRPAAAGPTPSSPDGEPDGGGVFDLSFDWADGRWPLVGCTD